MLEFVRIRHATQEDLPTLEALAKQDGHGTVFPTHVVEKGEQIIGWLHIGIGMLPVVLVWMDTTRSNSRDSWVVVQFFENAAKDRGALGVMLPCKEDSPFYPFLERLGYTTSKTHVFMKFI